MTHSRIIIAAMLAVQALIIQTGRAAALEDSFSNSSSWTLASTSNLATVEESTSDVSRVLNVFNFGAIADGNSHPVSTLYSTQAQIDAAYGAGKYTLTDELDYVGICEALATAKKNSVLYTAGTGNIQCWGVYMPTGRYKINRTINIANMYGLNLCGTGHMMTKLIFTAASELFHVESSGHITFRDFSIESTVASKSTGFHFRDQTPAPPTFKFHFDSVGFESLYRSILASGNTMVCEYVFMRCRFVNCLTGIHLKNDQSLNWTFVGCDYEPTGADSAFAPYNPADAVFARVEAGGAINVYGGSFIMNGTTLLLDPNTAVAANPINMSNGVYNFHGVRWEQLGTYDRPLLFSQTATPRVRARINFDDCSIIQRVAAYNKDLGVLKNGMMVSVRNCNFMNGNGKIQLYVDSTTQDYWGTLTVDNSKWLDYYEVRDPAVASYPYIRHLVRYVNSPVASSDAVVHGGIPKYNTMDCDILPKDVMSATRSKRIYYREPSGSLGSWTAYMYVPKHATITKIGIVKTSTESASYIISNNTGPAVNFGTVATDATNKKAFISDIEIVNDGTAWDGSVKIARQAGTGGSGYFFIEYF